MLLQDTGVWSWLRLGRSIKMPQDFATIGEVYVEANTSTWNCFSKESAKCGI